MPLPFAVNSISRSMGLPDLYPLVLAPPVIVKLSLIHGRVREGGERHSEDAGRSALRAVIAGLKRAIGSPEPI